MTVSDRGNDPLARPLRVIESVAEWLRLDRPILSRDLDAAVVEVREQLWQSKAEDGGGRAAEVKAAVAERAAEPNGWTRLAALIRLENAMGVVLAGLKAGDNIALAWHEWPESRDLDEIEETLRSLDAMTAVRDCGSCKITLSPDERIGTRMGDGFFCSAFDCPIMRDRVSPQRSRHSLSPDTGSSAASKELPCESGVEAESDRLDRAFDERVEAIARGEVIPPDCPDCGHNGRVEPWSTGGDGWECYGCGCIGSFVEIA